ncbi:hypothetical protein [Desulfosediminicola sp.]|uniref:hypothetical protein n=1 Tax=Desulfosediminicola sp. TaxID=2886825 RepID=UPI003AF2A706
MPAKAKVLYIVSAGHSGSTLLDLICGTLPGVFSMGETHFLSWQLKQGEIKNDPQSYCSCGQYFDKCHFWYPILREFTEDLRSDIFANPEKSDFSLNRGIIRGKRYVQHRYLNALFSRSMRFRVLRPLKNIIFWVYRERVKNVWKLYDRVAAKSGCQFVVDSSKDINRAFLLKMYRPSDVQILVLKRDVRGVASSSHYGLTDEMVKERTKRWVEFYYKKLPEYFVQLSEQEIYEVNYEKLCSDYNGVRADIFAFLKLEPTLLKPIESIAPYKYHTVQGNPMRLAKEDLNIKYDERWKQRLKENQVRWISQYCENNI